MTKHLHRIRGVLRDKLLERGLPLRPPLPPAARDGYTALWLWSESGEIIERLSPEDVVSARDGLPPDLPLATAPVRAAAVAYQLVERDQWIVLGRIGARVPVPVQEEHCLGYAEPMLVYLTEVDEVWASGCINLLHAPTPRHIRIAPGRHYAELWTTPIGRNEIEPEMLRLAQVLPRFY